MSNNNCSGICIYDTNGAVYSRSDYQLISENIKRILMTRKGERVDNPEFGSDCQKFLFMPQLAIDDLIAEIKSSVERWEPRVTVESCTFSKATQDDVVDIDLKVRLVSGEELNVGVEV